MAIAKPKNQDIPTQATEEPARKTGSIQQRPATYGSLGRPGIGRQGAMTPFSFVRRMMDDMDRLFEGFGSGMIGSDLFEESPLETSKELGPLGQTGWTPQIEMLERDGRLIVRADLPGLDKKDIRVNLEDDAIVIQGERRAEKEDNREGYLHSERSYGSFQRRIPLPRGVQPSSCDATFENGVLEVKLELPKSVGRSVEIRGGAPAGAAQAGEVAAGTQPPVNQTTSQPATRSNQNGPAASR